MLAATTVALLAFGRSPAPAAATDQVWLAVSDIHLNVFDRSSRPSDYHFDSNLALLRSAVAHMKRTVRDPAVVLLAGDFLTHSFSKRAGRESIDPDAAGLASMRSIASILGRAFPKARFAITLGNNDFPCGDYRSGRSRYLDRVAHIWKPLVDRDGASPGFETSFSRGGYYTASLPLPGLRLVVLNTVPFSTEYRGPCRGGGDPTSAEMTWFAKVLRDTPAGTRNVVMMHIPPGFDAFATEYVRGFIAWPFLKPRYSRALLDTIQRSRGSIPFAVAGHTHRFDFRLARGVPIVGLGALSPIYDNNPTYYALHVTPEGGLRDIDDYVFDESRQAWLPARSFDRTWGLARVDGSTLAQLHERIGAAPDARATWNRQASGWSSAVDDPYEPWGINWRVAWCVQTFLGPDFGSCAGIERRVGVLAALVFLSLVALAGLVLALALRLSRTQ